MPRIPKNTARATFGYKLSVSVGNKHSFTRGVATGTASEHDGHHFDGVLDPDNTENKSEQTRPTSVANARTCWACWDSKMGCSARPKPGKPLSECQERRNQRIAKKRAKVEHACHCSHSAHGR